MRESGYYPAGAEFDPRAPYNQDEPEIVTCPDCGGDGYHYSAWNIRTGQTQNISHEQWSSLPADEDEAEAMDIEWVRNEPEACNTCDGTGEVEKDDEPDDPDDYDDYDDNKLLDFL